MMAKINPFKLYYLRKKAGYSKGDIGRKTGILASKISKYESGTAVSGAVPESIRDFAEIKADEIHRLEKALDCPGHLSAGQGDDFADEYTSFYRTNHAQIETEPGNATNPVPMPPKAIIFDFEGTLTKKGFQDSTWERLWLKSGYSKNDCGLLMAQFLKGEITHVEWCDETLEKFKAGNLNESMVKEVANEIVLLDGFEETISQIYQANIPMFIVSGSIQDIIIHVLGSNINYFQEIVANDMLFDASGVLYDIKSTEYDFKGKGKYVKKVAADLAIKPSEILFVGNSFNDEYVRRISGAKTLLVNPHQTTFSGKWDYFIPHMENLTEILPYIGITTNKSTVPLPHHYDRIINFLQNTESIDLNNYTVVGECRRYDKKTRGYLQTLSDKISSSLKVRLTTRENYIIHAAPGSGKTYLVQEIAHMLGKKIQYIEIDLSKHTKEQILKNLEKLDSVIQPCLVLIDEIDGKPGEDWPYEAIYKKLDRNTEPDHDNTTVIILVGSTGKKVDDLITAVRKRHKGNDLIERVEDSATYRVEIPSLGVEDAACVFISKILSDAVAKRIAITLIEKMAIYYAVKNYSNKPRQLAMLSAQAINRIKKTEILKYDHLFEAGDLTRIDFMKHNDHAVDSLGSTNIKVSSRI